MNVAEIPFVKKTGIIKTENNELILPFTSDTHNHLKTMHASAQFTLAETASGEFLQTSFPDLAGKVIPVLRKGRASITVNVDIKDTEGTLTCIASYNWFIQKLE